MFASCLYDKFACAVWSDPGIVFDERDRRKQNPSGSVNYWDVWYLGFELGATADPTAAGGFRKLPSEGQARTGAYKTLVEGGHDLVELHALMAPRPFLVSGGTADLAGALAGPEPCNRRQQAAGLREPGRHDGPPNAYAHRRGQ